MASVARKKMAKVEERQVTPLTRIAILGPFAALLAVPTAIFPQDLGDIATALLTCAGLIVSGLLFKYTRIPFLEKAADTVLDRTVNARRNWEHDTLRSFVETACWLYVTFQIHVALQNAVLSVIVGTMAGFGMTAVGSILTSFLRSVDHYVAENYDIKHWKYAALATPEALMMGAILLFGVALRMRGRGEAEPSNAVRVAIVSAILASTSIVTLGQLMLRYPPTHRYGSIVHDRLVNCNSNWAAHTLRSALEVSLWLAATWGSYSVTRDMLSATVLGTSAGLLACVIGQEVLTADFSRLEKDLARNEREDMEWREEKGVSTLVPRFYKPRARRSVKKDSASGTAGKTEKDLPKSVTVAEVMKHNTTEDLWVIIDGHAYDLTELQFKHPGGRLPVQNMAGQDCTDAFNEYHPSFVHKTMLPQYYVAPVSDYKVSMLVQEQRNIRQELLRRGLFETDPNYYILKGIWFLSLLIPSCLGVYLSDNTYVHLASAVGLGCFWQQLAFVGHDVGHNSITHIQKKDNFYGSLLGNPLLGISLAWWKRSHNVHHIVCNSIDRDPDIQHLPVFAVTERIFGKFWSTYHEKFMVTDWISRTLVSYQHFLFYPIMAVARVNLYLQSWLLLLNPKEDVPYRRYEILGMVLFLGWQYTLYSCLGSTGEKLAFFALSHAISGILHVQICLSHFAMETYHGHPYEHDDWFMVQLRTSMNVDCPEWMDWFHGGLQFQIEHHMFPRLPRHNLRKARELVKDMCKRHNLKYHEPGFFQANKEMIAQLRRVAMDARKLKKGDGGFYESALWEGMNAQG